MARKSSSRRKTTRNTRNSETSPPDQQVVSSPEESQISEQLILARLDDLCTRLELLQPQPAESTTDSEALGQLTTTAETALRAVQEQQQEIQRVSSQMGRIEDLVAELQPQNHASTASHAEEIAAAETSEISGDSVQSWEQIKSGFLAPEDEEPAEQNDEVSASSDDDTFTPADLNFPLFSDSDIREMNEDELRDLILERERLVAVLARRVRRKERQRLTITPQQLRDCAEDLPEEFASKIRATLSTLDEQARLGELELSLERARISRQLCQLEDTRAVLESNARSLGLEINQNGELVGEVATLTKGSKNRKWLGALGFHAKGT